MKKTISRGFNLVEIAIVLVIFTLVITGILRGQELINSAKARNIIDQKASIQTAIVAFANRYKATAGDLTAAQVAFIGGGVLASSGGGNGIIAVTAAMPSGTGLDLFGEVFPSRLFDVGIAEEHAIVFAAGLAINGYKPVCAIYSTLDRKSVV